MTEIDTCEIWTIDRPQNSATTKINTLTERGIFGDTSANQ